MELPAKWQRMPVLSLIRTAANAGRLARKAKAIAKEENVAFDFFDQWFDHSWSYCLNRCVAVMVRSSDVARLAQAVGLPEVTEEHVKRNPFEIAIRVDNLIRSFGHSVDDPEEDQLDD